jgi:hypothetical protein
MMNIATFKTIWNDPVGSKVISWVIILIITQVFILIWSLIKKIKFWQVYVNIYNFIDNIFKTKSKTLKNEEELESYDTIVKTAPTVFFHDRMCDSFPGFSNGFRWFDSQKDIRTRLKILLESPLTFDKWEGYGVDNKPIWWFSGSQALPIEKFEILDRNKVLINIDELIIEKIAAYRSRSYYEDFVYVQCLADKPTGLYKHDQVAIDLCFNENRVYHEFYGVFKNRKITSNEWNDGSTIIKGRPVSTLGAEQRCRVLTKYNFIITAKFSPYNCKYFSMNSGEYFGKLLHDDITFEDFVNWMKKFPKNHNDD